MEKVIHQFYDAFNACDHQKMKACYHPDIRFSDPAFGSLNAAETRAMWQMLCENQKGKGLKVACSNVRADEYSGSAHWEARYVFSRTGLKVHNRIEAQYKFKDGLIIEHHDVFDLHRWARQALGFRGWLLGGTAFFRRKLQQQSKAMLVRYMQKHNLK